ncbi:hypothetical protein CDAR_261921 [Caerostris darwini]|uniref:Uncharacterized protein n=1 Tax=Caerostris darwini TaxID=1538125 RepID=A0AAV4WZQ4_9ARAC|nr:hypothetical protein CDAR_261921 [Caerostris darwini]
MNMESRYTVAQIAPILHTTNQPSKCIFVCILEKNPINLLKKLDFLRNIMNMECGYSIAQTALIQQNIKDI